MQGLVSRLLGHLAALVPPALVLLLLGVQVAFGLRGFDRPDGSLLYMLQVPGVLLGWGGVAMLVPLLTWMIMDWWGYNLGGFALKGLGSGVLGVAIGGLVAISGGAADGGIVGAGLADLLVRSLGSTFGVVLLLVMIGPAGVLALSMQRAAPKPAPRADAKAAEQKPKRSWRARLPSFGVFKRKPKALPTAEKRAKQAWYPERRYDPQGTELPADFADRHGIRYADEEQAEPATEEAAQAPAPSAITREQEERLPTIPELLSGRFDRSHLDLGTAGIRGDPSGGPVDERAAFQEVEQDGPIHVDSEGRPVPPPPAPPPVTVEPEPEPDPEPVPEPAQPALPFVQLRAAAEGVDRPLMPGVHYADEVREEEQEPEAHEVEAELVGVATNGEATRAEGAAAGAAGLSSAVEQAVRGPARVEHGPPRRGRIDSLRETLVETFQQGGSSDRYLAKLEAIGMFDAVDPVPAAAARKRTTRSAKKKAARKKAAKKKSAKKRAQGKKAAKKKAVRKKAKRKVAARKKAARRAAPRKKAKAKAKKKARKKAAIRRVRRR